MSKVKTFYQHELRSQDVLFGRGAFVNNRQGNTYYRELVAKNGPRYKKLEKTASKQDIAMDVVRKVKERGGRFCSIYHATNSPQSKKTQQLWVVVSDTVAAQKTKQALRDMHKSN